MRVSGPRVVSMFALALAAAIGSAPVGLCAEPVDTLVITRDYTSLPRDAVSVREVPQPPKGDGKLRIADNLGAIMTDALVSAIQRELPSASVSRSAGTSPEDSGLVVDARFSKLVPGSRAKRFWVGFGAGKSVTEISGEVREAGTGRVVARFTQARLSWCCGFGDNDHEIRKNLDLAAADIAAVVAGHLDAGQAYEWIERAGGAPAGGGPTDGAPVD